MIVANPTVGSLLRILRDLPVEARTARISTHGCGHLRITAEPGVVSFVGVDASGDQPVEEGLTELAQQLTHPAT